MKRSEITVGGLYTARISGNFVTVRVDAIRETFHRARSGWAFDCTNLRTGRKVTFASAQRFRGVAKQPAAPPSEPTESPMMRQYREAKACHPGKLLLFRAGDFYETFDFDSETVARVLGLSMTNRGHTLVCAFPHQSLETYLRRLLHAGHRVAICEQVESAPKGKPVERVVVPGSLTEDSPPPAKKSPRCGCVNRHGTYPCDKPRGHAGPCNGDDGEAAPLPCSPEALLAGMTPEQRAELVDLTRTESRFQTVRMD